MKLNALLLLLLSVSVNAADLDPYTDYRYCGPNIARDADGSTARSTKVLAAFKKIHPCPSTGRTYGSCPGWAMDHDWPLACGGCDAVFNLSWMPNVIKSCAGTTCKDRYEIEMYCRRSNKPPPTNLIQ